MTKRAQYLSKRIIVTTISWLRVRCPETFDRHRSLGWRVQDEDKIRICAYHAVWSSSPSEPKGKTFTNNVCCLRYRGTSKRVRRTWKTKLGGASRVSHSELTTNSNSLSKCVIGKCGAQILRGILSYNPLPSKTCAKLFLRQQDSRLCPPTRSMRCSPPTRFVCKAAEPASAN